MYLTFSIPVFGLTLSTFASRFFKVIDYCYTMQISVILTSNMELKELSPFLGRRSWDRLEQMAPRLPNGESFMVDMFDLPSWRVKAGGR